MQPRLGNARFLTGLHQQHGTGILVAVPSQKGKGCEGQKNCTITSIAMKNQGQIQRSPSKTAAPNKFLYFQH